MVIDASAPPSMRLFSPPQGAGESCRGPVRNDAVTHQRTMRQLTDNRRRRIRHLRYRGCTFNRRAFGSSPSVRHVSARAARSKRSGAPQLRSARWETSFGPPAAAVRLARASRGNDPIQPASRLDEPLRPVQAPAASLQLMLSSCLARHHTRSRSRSQLMCPRA